MNATGTGGYAASSVTYAPLTPTTTAPGPVGDDQVAATTMPFAFSFYGVSYSSVNISTNGNIQFGTSNSNAFVAAPIPTAAVPNNYIALSWNDWSTTTSGNITTFTTGTTPNRCFVVSYNNVGAYSGGGTLTGQIMLFETSNLIELHLSTQNNTTYSKVQGLENTDGSGGIAVTGRNYTNWTASNDAWRFTPPTYAWSPATGLSATNTATVTASPTTTTTYTVTVTNGASCSGSSTQLVTVNPTPTAPTTTSASRCGPGTVTLTAAGAPTGGSYAWYPAATGGAAIAGATTASYTTPSLSTTTVYYVSALNSAANGSCESASRTASTATINAAPAAPTTTSASRCGPGTVTLTAAGAPTGGSYAWYPTATGGAAIAGATTASYTTPSLSTTTVYYVSALNSAANGSCESTNRTAGTATINAAPTAAIVAQGSTTFCAGGSVVLTANNGTATPSGATAFLNAPNASGSQITCDCPTGYVAVGYSGYTGSWMDRVQLACKQLNPDGTLGTAVVYTNSNGTSGGGSPNGPYNLPGNTVLIGGTATTNSSNYLNGIQGFGQSVAYVNGAGDNTTGYVSGGSMSSGGGSSLGNVFAPNGMVVIGMTGWNTYYTSGISFRYAPISQFLQTYAWSPATGLNTTTGSSVTASPSTTTTYTVTATSNTGCQATATQTVTVATESLWTGNTSTDWYDATNWIGCVPSITIDGRIPVGRTNYPSVTAGTTAVVRTLTIENGGALTMNTATLRASGNFLNLNPTAMSMTGTLQLEGNSPVFSNIGTVNNLTLALNSGTVTLPQALTVNTALTLTNGLLNTGTFALTLTPTATLIETETQYVIGNVVTIRPLVPGTANAFGGLGLTLTPAVSSTAPGSTSITRVTGTRLTGTGTSQSVQRYFIIHPTTNVGLNVNMLFGYWIHELNAATDAPNLRLFRSVNDAFGPWQPYGQQGINTVLNTVTRNNIAAFSTWTLGTSNSPLPMELMTFTAERNGADAQLRWTTASEKNSDRFEVESSADGSRFTLIGTRPGQGTSTIPASYELLDANVARYAQPVVYYRLRQVDQDGTVSYSAVRTVQVAPVAKLSVLALPTPFDQYLTVRVTTPTAGPTTLRLTDALGRQLLSQAVNLQSGTNDLLLEEAAKVPSGVYLLQVTQGAVRCAIKVVRR